jgi:hypothetical protein
LKPASVRPSHGLLESKINEQLMEFLETFKEMEEGYEVDVALLHTKEKLNKNDTGPTAPTLAVASSPYPLV